MPVRNLAKIQPIGAYNVETITYYYRGLVERGNGRPGYDWREGFSANGPQGGILFPWLTVRECQQAAKSQGKKAVFVRDQEHKSA